MRAHPDLVGGPDGADERLMRRAAGGSPRAEPKDCSAQAGRNGTGVALKAEDGASRPLGPALAAFLEPFGSRYLTWATIPLTNSRGNVVGELVVTS